VSNYYPPEFKAQIVALFHQGERSYIDLAKEYNLAPTSIANWVKQAERGQQPVGEEKHQIAELKRQLKKKDEELEILGKALAFFVRKQDQ
jgi:transposase